MRTLNSPSDDLEAAALESSRKSPAKCISIMTAGWELPLRKWTVRWWQNVFCTEATSLKRPKKTPIAQISKPSLCHNPEEDLAYAQAVTKYVTKEMLICYFSRSCKPNGYQERNERALPSKCSGNQWLSQWQEGRTTARGVFA